MFHLRAPTTRLGNEVLLDSVALLIPTEDCHSTSKTEKYYTVFQASKLEISVIVSNFVYLNRKVSFFSLTAL